MRMKRIATYLGYCLDVDGKERQGLRSLPSLALAYILTLDTLGYIHMYTWIHTWIHTYVPDPCLWSLGTLQEVDICGNNDLFIQAIMTWLWRAIDLG